MMTRSTKAVNEHLSTIWTQLNPPKYKKKNKKKVTKKQNKHYNTGSSRVKSTRQTST